MGVGSPAPNYRRFKKNPDEWNKVVDEQLRRSGLQQTISRLTTDMVIKAQQRVLMHEAKTMRTLLRKSINEQKWAHVFAYLTQLP